MRDRKRAKVPNQIVGNAGLYYVCYELSKRGWNVLPTSRNARGVDIAIYNQSATETHTIQVKALSKRDPVPLGSNLDNLIAEFIVICRRVFHEKPEIFVARVHEVRGKILKRVKDERLSHWLDTRDYEPFKDKWDKIGDGYE